ncbi:LysR family transcriptional regulator [Pseudooctadecabacter jejudonensis]|uniref:HTH-type transcriptional regulator YjiE n=1 Tax=Pseudooctadecabacter jejudonensis TaxID=1391910 RepID=A0A1Y5SR03_9RHOB|nr:LysR family transcriptional regulator [Pseudooctadecabacter jejudonensis]SLN45740.1 HTH-type transcriptional regulator YjiE [Pseudooctadecabacter jejudonensis]
MEIAWLQDFVALAQTGVFARAAEKRNVTQPAFTRRIKRLEYALGAEIIDRSVHPVVLTEAGQKFLPTAQSMIYEWERSRTELSEAGASSEKIRIATLQSLSVSYVPNMIKNLYPNGRAPYFQIVADNFAGCIEALISGDVDAMLCYSHKDIQTGDHVLDRASYCIGEDRLIPVSRVDHDEPVFSLRDQDVPYLKYSKISFLGRTTNLMIERCPEPPSLLPVYEDSIAAALKSAVIEGLGIAWLPKALVQDELAAGTLQNISPDAGLFEVPIKVSLYEGKRKETRSTGRFWDKVRLLAE